MTFTKILESSYVQLCLIFVFAVLLKELDLLPSYLLNFRLFAYILPLFSIPALLKIRKTKHNRFPHTELVLLFLFLFIFIVRLIPYLHTEVTLGYDPGFYKYAIEMYVDNLPNIPENTLPDWLKSMYPQGLFVLTDALHIFAGFDSLQLFKILFPFLCSLLILPVYVLTRYLFDDRSAMIASFLYALSYTQYTLFTFLYFKNVIGLIFLLLAIYLLEKKKYMPLVIMYAALGIYHRPEFLLFSLMLIPYFLHFRDKNIIYVVVATAILITPFWLPRFADNLLMMHGVAETALTNIQTTQTSEGGGTFFGFKTYEWVSLAYLPFGLIGVLYMLFQKKWNSFMYGFLINASIVVFQLFFYKRLIIPFDILLIVLAGAGLNYGFLESKVVSKKLGALAVILLLISSGIVLMDQASNARPLINDDQLETIEWLASNTEPDAYILATSHDAPWVLGWSERKVIAPGLFQWDKYNRSRWIEFLQTEDVDTAKDFLSEWDGTIYIYYSKNKGNYMNLQKFDDNEFIQKRNNQSIVYKYKGKMNETR